MKVYHFKVSLFGYHAVPSNKLHRVLAIGENNTFDDLHELIFQAFDRYDPHLYSFFLTKQDSKSMRAIMDAPALLDPFSFAEGMYFTPSKNAGTTTLKQAKLKEKDVIHYWFDFGDDWWHRLRLERITTEQTDEKSILRIEKKVGESPAQYPDFDEDDEYNDE